MSRMILLKQVGCKTDLGRASKMPCATYSLPAQECKVGQALAKIPGSVCHGCYADGRGNYRWESVQQTLSLYRKRYVGHRIPRVGERIILLPPVVNPC
jgi:hypothetical protein